MERRLRRATRRIMIATRSSLYVVVACGLLTLALFLTIRRHGDSSSTWNLPGQHSSAKSHVVNPNYRSASASWEKMDTTSEIGRSSNATLGFDKVVVLGLKERSDKRDAISLAASLTGFKIEFFDAPKGEQIPDKALPPGMGLKGGALGAWRGHMDAIRSVIENNLASLFIMEDDADWDIRLLSQLPGLAKGVRSLSNIPASKPQHSPYGDDWDVIWPGHCGDVPPTDDDRRYIIDNDETVAPKAHQPWLIDLKNYPDFTRTVHKAGAPLCTFGYAVSYRGAQKILMALGVKGAGNLAIDNGLGYLCRDGFLDMKCYSIEPQLFQHHRPAGSVSKDSDINNGDPAVVREKGFTDIIVLSARLNLEQSITGSTEYVTQW